MAKLHPLLTLFPLLAACSPQEEEPLPLDRLLAGQEKTGYARALAPIPFQFPRDHGPHPDFKHEWWYLTGNLATPEGRRFGYQWTLFRFALAPALLPRPSQWASRTVYMAHLTLTDVAGERFHHHQRLSREALGLAGVQAEPFRAWLSDWRVTGPPSERLHLQAREGGVGLDLELAAVKPIALQGEAGWSRKGDEPGQASYYYSITRLATQGRVRVAGQEFPVTGASWFDREWGSGALSREQSGWDWFGLHLDHGWDLSHYRLRRKDGTPDSHDRGLLVDPEGGVQPLLDLAVTSGEPWSSPHTGVAYPMAWQLTAPDFDLKVRPLLPDQELHATSVRYWEGAVAVTGVWRGAPVNGHGYLEMAGYGGS